MEKLSITKCRKLLGKYGEDFSDEKIMKIRDCCYKLANLEYFLFTEQKKRMEKEASSKHPPSSLKEAGQ
jgi:hypothetical protein